MRVGQVPLRDGADQGREEEHVEAGEQRHEHQPPGAQRAGPDADLLHQPAAEVLQRDDVATPAAEEAPEQCGQNQQQQGADQKRSGHDSSLNRFMLSGQSPGMARL